MPYWNGREQSSLFSTFKLVVIRTSQSSEGLRENYNFLSIFIRWINAFYDATGFLGKYYPIVSISTGYIVFSLVSSRETKESLCSEDAYSVLCTHSPTEVRM